MPPIDISEILPSLLSSILTGMYSGLVVARYQEFNALREEACRIVFNHSTVEGWPDQISLISASLSRAKHEKAAQQLKSLAKQAEVLFNRPKELLENAPIPMPSINEAGRMIHEKVKICDGIRKIPPSKIRILLPF